MPDAKHVTMIDSAGSTCMREACRRVGIYVDVSIKAVVFFGFKDRGFVATGAYAEAS